MGFLDIEETRWACYLVTYQTGAQRWCGYLTFRNDSGERTQTVRTTNMFIESGEREIERKARQLGRPLLSGLLASALNTRPDHRKAARVRGWVQEALGRRRNQDRVRGGAAPADGHVSTDVDAVLRSRYETYCLDQITHLVTLIPEAAWAEVVEELVKGASFAFRSKDRLQFSLLVVQRLEGLLRLPPFEVWRADYQRHRAEHERYRHELQSGEAP